MCLMLMFQLMFCIQGKQSELGGMQQQLQDARDLTAQFQRSNIDNVKKVKVNLASG